MNNTTLAALIDDLIGQGYPQSVRERAKRRLADDLQAAGKRAGEDAPTSDDDQEEEDAERWDGMA